jgi:hypothetical protein
MTVDRPLDNCTLPSGDLATRIDSWRTLLARATARRRGTGDVVLEFPAVPDLAALLAGLAVAETDCCGFVSFELAIAAGSVHLRVTGDGDDGRRLLDGMFDAAT